jgi:hypothetical protein
MYIPRTFLEYKNISQAKLCEILPDYAGIHGCILNNCNTQRADNPSVGEHGERERGGLV